MPYRSPHLSTRVCLFVALLLTLFADGQSVRAHGGVIIDSGFTSHFEWLISINPYPVTTGEATITLLVYDLTNYDPVNDLQATVYATEPDAAPAATQQESAGVELLIDPAIYPGDYSTNLPLDQVGEWQLRFTVEGGDRSFAVTTAVKVAAAPPALPDAATTPDLAATATVFAQNVAQARQQNSPLLAQNSPLAPNNPVEPAATVMDRLTTADFLGAPWWLWGLIAIIPIFMGWLLLRSAGPTLDDDLDDETDDERAAEDDNQQDGDQPLDAAGEGRNR